MEANEALFLYATGCGCLDRIPLMIEKFVDLKYTVYSVLTPNVSLVTPPALIMEVPGNTWIHHYHQKKLKEFPFGTQLIAPCTFNTLNKIALGIADNLATSMIADGLGNGFPVVIAPAMNRGLWGHPRIKESIDKLTSWGVEIVARDPESEFGAMAPIDEIVKAVERVTLAAQ